MQVIEKKAGAVSFFEIDLLSADDDALRAISAETGIGLSPDEMTRVKAYFTSLGRNPTDVELQAIGQSWSEHCCYKSSKAVLREFIFGIDRDDVLDRGDAGVVSFNDDYAYALRIESHNHPSAVEPYGGAATGIGGIVRDILAMGAQPIALIDPLYFGPPDYPQSAVPKGTKHPKYLFSNVVAGIRDYGNRIGIPTVSGLVYFDPSYVGNCLVNVGCVGIVKKDELIKNAVKGAGDVFILTGGRTGRDGIHGVTFASAVLTEDSEESSRSAVQLGDPIMKEPLIHACRACVEGHLLSGMKDLGGGGLSCVIGELAEAGGKGAAITLDRVPLKEAGMAPWEIWVSESQERMMLVVPQENVERVLHIFALYDVPATVIGEVTDEETVTITYDGTPVFALPTSFLVQAPEYCRPCAVDNVIAPLSDNPPAERDEYTEALFDLLADLNIASRDWVIRQYDHEVRGATAVKPLQGRIATQAHGDAAVIKPVDDSYRGLAIATAASPSLTALDPYKGGAAVMDEVCRMLVAVGATPHSLTNCLNFGDPENPARLGQFREAVRGMGAVAQALTLPMPSGNVSLYNESQAGTVLPTISLMGCGIIDDVRRAVTTDIKKSGTVLYHVGTVQPAMAASAYYRIAGAETPHAPDVDIDVLKASIDAMNAAFATGAVLACHDVSDGGLAVCVAEMCMGGGCGATLDLGVLGDGRTDALLFSESPTRWIVEVDPDYENAFTDALDAVPHQKLGETGGDMLTITRGDASVLSAAVAALYAQWSTALWKVMG